MFKKGIKLQNRNNVKRSEVKRMRGALARAFPAALADASPHADANFALLFPPKEEIFVAKVAGSRSLVYFVNDTPVFYDLDGRADYYPTGINRELSIYLSIYRDLS